MEQTFVAHLESATSWLMPIAVNLTRNPETAQDLVQDTLFKAYIHRKTFQQDTNIRAWLYRIMYNAFASEYKRRKTIQEASKKLEETYIARSLRKENPASYKEVYAVVNKLNKTHREPFLMHFKGFKYKEIAKFLSIPIGTVKNRIHLAKKDLQRILKPYQASYI